MDRTHDEKSVQTSSQHKLTLINHLEKNPYEVEEDMGIVPGNCLLNCRKRTRPITRPKYSALYVTLRTFPTSMTITSLAFRVECSYQMQENFFLYETTTRQEKQDENSGNLVVMETCIVVFKHMLCREL